MSRLFQRFGNRKIVTPQGSATQEFDRGLQKAFDELEARLTDIEAIQTDLASQLAQIVAAQAAADAAHRNDAISGSWLSPDTVLSATDAGSDATVAVAGHTRKYGDATSAVVNAGSVTGQPYGTEIHVGYTDAARAGGTVTFIGSTNPNTVANNASTGMHYVGSVTTPGAGSPPTSGTGSRPPGYTGTGAIP